MVLHFNLWYAFLFSLISMLVYAAIGGVITLVFMTILSACFLGYFKYKEKGVCASDIIVLTASLINLWYVVSSWGNVRQYDYYNFYMHADYFIQNHFFIDKSTSYLQSVFFQPPLWGLMVGLVTQAMMYFGEAEESAFAFSRFLSFFAISGTYIIFWRFINQFEWKKNILLWVFGLFCFMPIHGILANLVNNDAFVYFLMLTVLYESYLWYQTIQWKKSLLICLLLFIAGMIKFSGLMVAPAVLLLGGIHFINSKNERGRILLQSFLIFFGALLGFGWGVFLLYHHAPLVPPPVDVQFQNMQHFSLLQRLFSIDMIGVPFAEVRRGLVEPNVWLTLIKTSLFGEWSWQGYWAAYILYTLGGAFAVLCVCGFCSLFTHKIGKDFAFNGAIVLLVFTVLGAWINFWLDYPYFCSSEFRYTIILLPVSPLWLGNYISNKNLPQFVLRFMAGLILIFIGARFMLYLYTI